MTAAVGAFWQSFSRRSRPRLHLPLYQGLSLDRARLRVWLQRRLYWLRCRIVNANNT
jgi:hypothetical protein